MNLINKFNRIFKDQILNQKERYLKMFKLIYKLQNKQQNNLKKSKKINKIFNKT